MLAKEDRQVLGFVVLDKRDDIVHYDVDLLAGKSLLHIFRNNESRRKGRGQIYL